MKKIYMLATALVTGLGAGAQIGMDHITTYFTGTYNEGAAEIVTYDAGTQKLFFSNADENTVGILDFSDPTALTLSSTIDIDVYGDGVNSVSAYNGNIAVAVEVDQEPGKVVFFDHQGTFISQVTVGHLPDMLTFTPDGSKVVVACEGEPSSDWVYDPAGAVAIIDVSGGLATLGQDDVTLVDFSTYAGSWDDVRFFGPDTIFPIWENFQDTALELNNFMTYNDYSTTTWYFDSFNDDYFAEANGFGDDTASSDWLISPVVDLQWFENAYLSFINTKNFSGGTFDLLISSDYDGSGNPTGFTWDTLSSLVTWSAGGYVDTHSGDIDLSGYLGSSVAFAFHYTSTGTGGGTGALWQIDDIKVSGLHAMISTVEPEYVAVSSDNGTAFVTLQENNAVAVINLSNGSITDILPLGWKDHSVEGNGLDASDRDDEINITTYPFRGLYLPDAIATTTIGGTMYALTANEGDARDYDAYAEEERLEDVVLDPMVFTDAATLQDEVNGGRINITTSMGDTDNDGDFDEIYTFGARSFTIWDASGNVVFDSGDEFEQITATEFPDDFNSGNEENDDFDSRSDGKGPEPEAIEVAAIGDKHYAFIGLERIGGIMMYDITDPANASFVAYVNNRDFSAADPTSQAIGDLGCEDVVYIDSAASPDGKFYLVTSNEVSGTVSVFEISGLLGADQAAGQAKWAVYPNPTNGMIQLGVAGNYTVRDISGRVVAEVRGESALNLSNAAPGLYTVSDDAGNTARVVKN